MHKRENELQTSIASSAVLSFLGWLGSQGSSVAPSPVIMAKGRRLRNSGGGGGGGAGSMAPTASADLRVRPPDNRNVPKHVPRSIPNQVVWDVVKLDVTLTSSTSGVSESNFTFALSSHPQASQWAMLFDQWTVVQASASFQSLLPPGSSLIPLKLYTALDFDSSTNITSVSAIEDFSTASCVAMEPGARVVRSVKPCCKPSINGNSAGVQRSWVDSSYTSTPFFGIRTMLSQSATAVQTVSVTQTIWFAFRNQI